MGGLGKTVLEPSRNQPLRRATLKSESLAGGCVTVSTPAFGRTCGAVTLDGQRVVSCLSSVEVPQGMLSQAYSADDYSSEYGLRFMEFPVHSN